MKKKAAPPADGRHKECFAGGGLSGEGRYKGGKRHGKWKFYYKSGGLKAVGKYVDGELDGPWEWWRENGQPLQAGAFKLGIQVGSSIDYSMKSGEFLMDARIERRER